MTEAPKGHRFSHVYLERGSPGPDSERFRRRLLSIFWEVHTVNVPLNKAVERELGIAIPYWENFFKGAELRDILDSITILFSTLRRHSYGQNANKWRDEARRIVREENVAYRIDDEAGVHLGVDEEFEHNRASTLRRLGAPRYEAALACFESAHAALDSDHPDGRAAVRHLFDALETVFRLMLGRKVSRLGASEIERHFKPILQEGLTGAARDAAGLMGNSLSDWINAAHQYRHAQGVETTEPMPLDLAILMVSTGAGFLRWLVDLDEHSSAGAVKTP